MLKSIIWSRFKYFNVAVLTVIDGVGMKGPDVGIGSWATLEDIK